MSVKGEWYRAQIEADPVKRARLHGMQQSSEPDDIDEIDALLGETAGQGDSIGFVGLSPEAAEDWFGDAW